jgi:carbon storage regulator
MLVITRKSGERLVIGEGEHAVAVTVLEVAAGRVRLGVECPVDWAVVRGELIDRRAEAGGEG